MKQQNREKDDCQNNARIQKKNNVQISLLSPGQKSYVRGGNTTNKGQSLKHLSKLKQHAANVLQNETLDQRDKRLSQVRQHRTQVNENKTLEKKHERLSKLRQHKTQVLQNETPEERQKRLLKKRKCYKRSRRSQNPESVMKQCTSDPIAELVTKFHKDVSERPLFFCTCCSQLWYKHSVCPAERTRLRWSNTKNIFLSLMLSDCSFTVLLCELP